ncbi:cellulose biosynthesis cyclic di-GMP-binding regulatory protein BcsB [uncultured Hoeflea sp.]|uniref:cellulose biosynthesis cyclic di-GMP-binding regulatory protein BcsB n=1 Tax=uncultured Hoeflea sp. TaxID=538666 RepID=UPI0030EF4B27|tara:strand:- start:56288 stop:58654 length:2367 start_codon:yes stop_codon:yes gene_type:complete
MHKVFSSLITIVALAAPVAPAAMAQSLLSEPQVKSPVVSLEGLGQSTILSTRPSEALAAALTRDPTLTAFEQSKSTLRFEGEDDVVNLTFLLDPRSVAAGGDLVLAYRNAVSVMPETSVVSVMVNGAPVGNFPVRSPSGFSTQTIAVPTSTLRAGVNEVQLRAVQQHRVDCSMEATYELWTELDEQTSGFRPHSAQGSNGFASLRKVGRDARGLTDLRLVLPRGSGAAALNRAAPMVQTLALALNRDDISVTVAETAGTGPGIDLLVASDDDQASLSVIRSDTPHGLSLAPGGDPLRHTVVLRASNAREIPNLVLNAVQGPLKPVFDSGIRAQRSGEIRAEASSVYTLADAGYVPAPFTGRLFRTRFDMVMPADFYPAEYATLDLALHGATSPGLKPTSQLLVRVNDQIVKSLPMRDTGGEVFSGRKLELPLRAFRPGRNQIELLAELERPADDACVFAERDDSVPRFILLDTTEIRVPALARVARLPELAALAGSAYPYAGTNAVNVHVLQPDAGSISTALTVLAKMSNSAKTPLLAQFNFGPPKAGAEGNALVVASRQATDELARLGPNRFPALSGQIDFAPALESADPIVTSAINLPTVATPLAVTSDPSALLEAFRQTTRDQPGGNTFSDGLSVKLDELYQSFRQWLNYRSSADQLAPAEPARKAVLTQRPNVSGDGVVTWLTADTAFEMREVAQMLSSPAVWNRIEGESVVFDLDANTIRSTKPEAYFAHKLSDYGPGNLRRIAAAWFSDHFRIYVVLVIALMAVFAIWLGRLVPGAGVRSDQ